jgi:hypothetical protein
MKISKLKARLQKERPMITVTLRMPEDVVEDLKKVAPYRGMTGYQPLIRAYVGQGLREDLSAMEAQPDYGKLIAILEEQGIKKAAIKKAFAEAGLPVAV